MKHLNQKKSPSRRLPSRSFERLHWEKEAARVKDMRRVARGTTTARTLQRQNSIFTREEIVGFRILNLEKVLLWMR